MKRGMLKIDKILNFQGSLFCGFIDIKAKTDIILELLTNLQKEVFINFANYAQTECQFRYCGTAIPFLTVRSTAR